MEIFAFIFAVSLVLFIAFSIKDAMYTVYIDHDGDLVWPLRSRILAAVFMVSGAIWFTWLVYTGEVGL